MSPQRRETKSLARLPPQPNGLWYDEQTNAKNRRAQRFGSSLRSSFLCVVKNVCVLREFRAFAVQRRKTLHCKRLECAHRARISWFAAKVAPNTTNVAASAAGEFFSDHTIRGLSPPGYTTGPLRGRNRRVSGAGMQSWARAHRGKTDPTSTKPRRADVVRSGAVCLRLQAAPSDALADPLPRPFAVPALNQRTPSPFLPLHVHTPHIRRKARRTSGFTSFSKSSLR